MSVITSVNPISVVIICLNAVYSIDRALRSAIRLSDDVVVIDTGSTDASIEHILKYPVRLYKKEWEGYGATKNIGNALSLHPWILSMDADEELNDELITSIRNAPLTNEHHTFSMQRLSYLGQKAIRFGEWGRSYIVRIFNKHNAQWDTSEVHESLIFCSPATDFRLPGILHHYTSPDIQFFRAKLERYAKLMADKYFSRGKEATDAKVLLSPAVNFTINYIIKAGFLDGKEGWQIAKANAWYTFKKYRLLHQRQKQLKTSLKRKR